MPELRHRVGIRLGSDLIVRPWAVQSVEQARADRPRQKTPAEMQAEHQARLDRRPMTVACGFCDWVFHGLAGEARAAAKQHRQEWHPQPGRKRGRKGGEGLANWSRKGPTPEQEAEALARRLIHEKAAKRNP